VAEAAGEVETENKVMVLRRIHVRLRLKAPEAARKTAERVHGIFADRCAIYRSLCNAIKITTELIFEPE
jgi:uncharacterized OsmC-like protein